MNGVLYEQSTILRWLNAGAVFPFDATFAAAIGGYPKGARVLRADGFGIWVSLDENNLVDPNATVSQSWFPEFFGKYTNVTLGAANVTLTPAQISAKQIYFAGATAALTVTFPDVTDGLVCEWFLSNATNYPLTIKGARSGAVPFTLGPYQYALVTGRQGNVYSYFQWNWETGANVSGSGNLIGVQRFTASGTYTPTPGTKTIIVEAVGGGGAGGGAGATSTGQFSTSGGGGAGAYGKSKFTSGFSSVTVTIGAGGVGVAAGAGGAGGTTSFGAMLSCPGGDGCPYAGVYSLNSAIVTTSGATSAYPSGANLLSLPGAAGTIGSSGQNGGCAGGMGGGSLLGTGGRGAGFGGRNNGLGYGAGGSAALVGASSSALAGGDGAPGVVIVWEYA